MPDREGQVESFNAVKAYVVSARRNTSLCHGDWRSSRCDSNRFGTANGGEKLADVLLARGTTET